MAFTPFTLAEAEEIWDDFEDLRDTEFKRSGPIVFLVLDLVICPFDTEDKQKFIDSYRLTKSGESSLAGYTCDEYDVLIVACDVDDEASLYFIDMQTFVEEKGISYNFPG
jgi:hypothetical protein